MIQLERNLYNFPGIKFLMTLLHAWSTAWYSLNRRAWCLCVLTSSDKVAAVGSELGMTGWMPGFIAVINAMTQWVLNMVGCAFKISYPKVPHPNVQSTSGEHEFRYMLRFIIYSYVGTTARGASGYSENAPIILSSSGVMLMLISFRAMAWTFLISNNC